MPMPSRAIRCTSCRACGGRHHPLLDLGAIVPSDFLHPSAPDPEPIPLALVTCGSCGLVQLDRTTDPETLYRQYWYKSSVNEVMRAELAHVVSAAVAMVGGVSERDHVVDIGANDGTLLSHYALGGAHPLRVAYEPAHNLFSDLQQHAEVTMPDFFPSAGYPLRARSVKVATAIAMFYDLDNPRAFVQEIDRVLADDGVWVVQFQDLAQMVEACAFDNVVAEHLCYYSLQTFVSLLTGTDLAVVHAEPRSINGGSIRIYVRRTALATRPSELAQQMWQVEPQWTSPLALEKFAWQVGQRRQHIQAAVGAAVDHYGFLDLYAASTKSSTLLQYCGLDHSVIRQAAERTVEKWGLVTSGTRIPVVSEAAWRDDPAPVTLVGAWQFADVFTWREAGYLEDGGSFLVPLPTTRIVSEAVRRVS